MYSQIFLLCKIMCSVIFILNLKRALWLQVFYFLRDNGLNQRGPTTGSRAACGTILHKSCRAQAAVIFFWRTL